MKRFLCLMSAWAILAAPALGQDEEAVYSGPQIGEKLPPFKVQGVYGDEADKEFDFVTQADGKPLVLIFVHQLTRPAHAAYKAVMEYSAKRRPDGLHSALIYLGDDNTALSERLHRARGAMPKNTTIAMSTDGAEGPGSYGLNRKVTLTVLVANKGKVTANYALTQPSLQADVPKIVRSIVDQVGGKVPTLAELAPDRYAERRKKGNPKRDATPPRNEPDPNLRRLVAPVIRKDASEEDVTKAAATLEEFCAKNPATRKAVGDAARRIVQSGRLGNYGTAKAQEYLRKWAKDYR